MRQPRVVREGARYHVTARANRKEMILESGAMKELFLSVVKRAKKKYDFRIENFTVLGNHFHFIIQPMKGASLSAIMRWIMSVFAMAFNRAHGYWGHVWGSRFVSRILGNLRAYMQAFEYIDNNPVKACIAARSDEWRYGGLAHILEGRMDIVEPLPQWLAMLFPIHRQLSIEIP
jgi:putative transposase